MQKESYQIAGKTDRRKIGQFEYFDQYAAMISFGIKIQIITCQLVF